MINNLDLRILSKNDVGLFILIARRISHFGSKVKIYNLFFESKMNLSEKEKRNTTQKHILRITWLDLGDKTLYRSQNLNAAQGIECSPASPSKVESIEYGGFIYRMESWNALSEKGDNNTITWESIYWKCLPSNIWHPVTSPYVCHLSNSWTMCNG